MLHLPLLTGQIVDKQVAANTSQRKERARRCAEPQGADALRTDLLMGSGLRRGEHRQVQMSNDVATVTFERDVMYIHDNILEVIAIYALDTVETHER
jgi:hypothetical protein